MEVNFQNVFSPPMPSSSTSAALTWTKERHYPKSSQMVRRLKSSSRSLPAFSRPSRTTD